MHAMSLLEKCCNATPWLAIEEEFKRWYDWSAHCSTGASWR